VDISLVRVVAHHHYRLIRAVRHRVALIQIRLAQGLGLDRLLVGHVLGLAGTVRVFVVGLVTTASQIQCHALVAKGLLVNHLRAIVLLA